mmetsp:Transcript_3505/g.2528  ORF Transcript_3505/g.2528 Transcript_3505/m.2528 type:complete len:303 (-) Transcript_3505:197-1105(-)
MRHDNAGHRQLLQLHHHLLSFVFFFVGHLDGLCLPASCNAGFSAREVPDDHLAGDAPAHKHVLVLRMPLNAAHLQRTLQHVAQRNDVGVFEVHHQYVRVHRLTGNLRPLVEGQVFYHRHCNQVRLRGVELDTRNSFIFAVIMLYECPRQYINRADFGSIRRFFISQHFKVILKHIDEFIGLECGFYFVTCSFYELVKSFLHALFLLRVLLHLADEVAGIVLHDLVHRPIEVRLTLEPLYLVRGLKPHLEYFLLYGNRDVVPGLVSVRLLTSGVPLDETYPLRPKVLPQPRYTHPHQRPCIFD